MTVVLEQRAKIPEVQIPGMRLGRNIRHDPRSLAYRPAEVTTPVTTTWRRHIPILDQGDVGSCTGNAETGALGSDGVFQTLNASIQAQLDENYALKLYGLATQIDPYDGTYPPDDTGSDGLSVSKAAKTLGLISGYVHATSVDEMLAALQKGPGIIGINWYSSFDQPGSDGKLTLPPGATVRGGHEMHVLNVDVEQQQFEVCNSWSAGWGVEGRCFIGFTIMSRLLHEDGDATFPVPVTEPPPTPIDVTTKTRTFTAAQYSDLGKWAHQPHLFHNATVAAKAWKAGV